ncbi:transposase [Deinococcus pimensis]|uniref:transposase n=1 Tax=Deinococcus pimensis TaxID=309888 RepID=UPI00146FB508|nr:transposase [Deinococcus pimensis]
MLVPDVLWDVVELLLPNPRQPKGGRPFAAPRVTLAGIVYVLKDGIRWNAFPKHLAFPGGVTCWRGLREWQTEGVWCALHHLLLDQLAHVGLLDWSRSSLDSASVRAMKRGITADETRPIVESTAPNDTFFCCWYWQRHLTAANDPASHSEGATLN